MTMKLKDEHQKKKPKKPKRSRKPASKKSLNCSPLFLKAGLPDHQRVMICNILREFYGCKCQVLDGRCQPIDKILAVF